jgi:hypothetical protein
MALSSMQKTVLTAIGVGVVVGIVVGGIGAMLGLPASIRGALTGVIVVIALGWMSRRTRQGGGQV